MSKIALGLLLVVAALLAHVAAVTAQQSDSFSIVVARTSFDGDATHGTISVNGEVIGNTLENTKLRVAAGSYDGALRYFSAAGHAQGPFGTIGKKGDFLLEIVAAKSPAGAAKTNVLFHGGTLPEHSKGCILLGPVSKDEGVRYLDDEKHPLRVLRKKFYGTDDPTSTPNKVIVIEIKDPAK